MFIECLLRTRLSVKPLLRSYLLRQMALSGGANPHPVGEQSGERRIPLGAGLGAKRGPPSQITCSSPSGSPGEERPSPPRYTPHPHPRQAQRAWLQPPRCTPGCRSFRKHGSRSLMLWTYCYVILFSPHYNPVREGSIFAPI